MKQKRAANKPQTAGEDISSSVKPITSIKDLTDICKKKFTVEFNVDKQLFSLEARRLTPAEDASLEDILEAVLPPTIRPSKNPEEHYPDFSNPDFLKRKAIASREARALGLYLCVPALSADSPNLTDRAAITTHVQSQVNEQILALLWRVIRDGGVSRVELVNFS